MGDTALIDAVRRGDTALANDLIAAGHDVNACDADHGWSALNYAAGKGQLDMVTLLVEAGADVAPTGRDNRTPYDIALAAEHLPTAKYLAACLPAAERADQRQAYCRAYLMRDLQAFDRLTGEAEAMSPEAIVFLHHDHTVTESMFHGQDIIRIEVTAEWRDFCAQALGFSVPSDVEIVALARSQPDRNLGDFE